MQGVQFLYLHCISGQPVDIQEGETVRQNFQNNTPHLKNVKFIDVSFITKI